MGRSEPFPPPLDDLLQQEFGSRLTRREYEVFLYRLRGHSDSEIAADLMISQSTVKTHTEHIREKFGVQSVREIPFFVFCWLAGRSRQG